MSDPGFAGWTGVGAFSAFVCVVVTILGLGGLLLINFEGDLGCELSGSDSNYGELTWSLVPPGPACTFTSEVNGVDKVDGPSPVTSIWLVLVSSSAVFSVWALLRARREQSVAAARPS